MKQFLSLPLLMVAILCNSQQIDNRGEFATNSNGLMYSDGDIKHLRFIVDSLNLQFRSCELNKTYYSCPQGRKYYVTFKSSDSNLKEIIRDMENQVSFGELIKKYHSFMTRADSGEMIVKLPRQHKDGQHYYLEGNPGNGYDDISIEKWKGNWGYNYYDRRYSDKEFSLYCYYFPTSLKQMPIPANYARLIQYVDCMIDTTATIYLTDKYVGGRYVVRDKNIYQNLDELANYLDKAMGKKVANNKKLTVLTDEQLLFAKTKLQDDKTFLDILNRTIDDYVANKAPHFQLEDLAVHTGLFEKALLMKRSYRVMGFCSQDNSPREHARDIATMAARAHNWEIFLRAHLDIMNDRFERATDGSYAWHDRKTYLKELEELNINVVDLMLGLTLRSANVSSNHYFGTVWRIGWALSESKDREEFEKRAIAMMKDDALDEFNRGLMFLLYSTYTNYLDKKEGWEKRERLIKDIDTFPAFMQASIRRLNEKKANSDD